MKRIIIKITSLFLLILSLFTIDVRTIDAEDTTSFSVSWPNVNEYTYDGQEKTYSPIIDVNHIEVAYIETVGKAYINTGMYASDKSGIEISYCFTRKLNTNNQSYHLFGNVSDGGAVVRNIMYFSHHLESYNGGYYITAYGKRTEPGNTGDPPL